MGNESVVNTCIVTGLRISSLDCNQFIELSEVFSQKTIPVTTGNIPRQEDINCWPHLKEVKMPSIQAGIGLLTVADVPKAMEPLQLVSSVDNGPYAVRTILGWTENGPLRIGSNILKTNKLTEVTYTSKYPRMIISLWTWHHNPRNLWMVIPVCLPVRNKCIYQTTDQWLCNAS